MVEGSSKALTDNAFVQERDDASIAFIKEGRLADQALLDIIAFLRTL